jgi:hypothetical protein
MITITLRTAINGHTHFERKWVVAPDTNSKDFLKTLKQLCKDFEQQAAKIRRRKDEVKKGNKIPLLVGRHEI